MNKLLKFAGIIFFGLLITVAVIAAIAIPMSIKLSNDAAAFVEQNLPAIFSNWSTDELEKRSVVTQTAESKERILMYFFWGSSTLGKLKNLEKPVCGVGTGQLPGTKTDGTWGDCVVKVEFETGVAEMKILLKQASNSWEIVSFNIKSPALLPVR